MSAGVTLRALGRCAALVLVAATALPHDVAAQNMALENILVSKRNGLTNIQIWPACRMRYIDHTPGKAGLEMRIRVTADGECISLLEQVSNEVYLPMGRRLGNLTDVRFEDAGSGESYITLSFTSPQQFSVRQHSVGWIEVFVDTNVDSSTLPAAVPPPIGPTAPASVGPAAPMPDAAPDPIRPPVERPSRRQVAADANENYVIQLGVFSDVSAAVAALDQTGSDLHVYTNPFELNGKTWHGLQAGFFASEAAADAELAALRARFPDSWVRLASPDEALTAKAQPSISGPATGPMLAVAARSDSGSAADPATLTRWMADGRRALLDRRYDDAIVHYTQVLEAPPNEHHATAREYLGVALERRGNTQRAIAEYQAYLAGSPDNADARRVEERLRTLDSAAVAPPAAATAVSSRSASGWQVYGGVSQYYWRNEQQLVHDGNTLLASSGLLALGDVTATRRGSRYDILARLNGAYQFNFVEFDNRGDIGWLSDAYIDVADRELGLAAKAGRQARRDDGVLGRFDGVGLRYQWRPDISFSVSSGLPIDAPRYAADTGRFFYAASARVDNLWERFTVNAYTQHQTVDGIDDRRAVGGEVQYRNGGVNVIGLVDYDLTFAELNTALLNGIWILDNDWRLSGRVRTGMLPYLTTRNALAGQTVETIDELLESFTEGQIRTLARHRTAQASSVSAGLRLPLGERLDLSVDVTAQQADATVASAGVAALPETGTQLFVSTSLIAPSLFRDGDLSIFTFRHDSSRTRDASSLLVDVRLPLSERLRLSPRLSLMARKDNPSGTDQLVAEPAIRLIYRWGAFLFDLEAGGRWSSRELPATEIDAFTPDGTEELLGGFVNLGYRLEF